MYGRPLVYPACRRRTFLASLTAAASLPAIAAGQSETRGWHRPRGDQHSTGAADVAGPTRGLGVAWTRSVDAEVSGQPMVVGDHCVVGTADGRVLQTDLETGDPGWSTALAGERVRTPTPAADRLVVPTVGNEIYALDREGGAIYWRDSTEAAISSSAMIANGTALLGTERGEIIAFDVADGRRVWRVTLPEEILGVPTVVDETVVVRDRQGTVAALSLADGEETWRRDETAGNFGPAAYAAGRVFVCGTTSDGSGRVGAIDATDGSIDWERDLAGQLWTSLVVAHGHVYVFDNQGTLRALDATDGTTDWRVQFDEQVALAAGRDVLYVLTRSELSVYEPAGATERDRFRPDDDFGAYVTGRWDAEFASSPTPIPGGAVLASRDGTVWALRGGSGQFPIAALAGGASLTGLAAYGLYRWRRSG